MNSKSKILIHIKESLEFYTRYTQQSETYFVVMGLNEQRNDAYLRLQLNEQPVVATCGKVLTIDEFILFLEKGEYDIPHLAVQVDEAVNTMAGYANLIIEKYVQVFGQERLDYTIKAQKAFAAELANVINKLLGNVDKLIAEGETKVPPVPKGPSLTLIKSEE